MNKVTLLKILNPLLLLSMFAQSITGIMLFFSLFASTRFYEISANIHEYNGIVLVVLAGMHIYLNWGWIKSSYLKLRH